MEMKIVLCLLVLVTITSALPWHQRQNGRGRGPPAWVRNGQGPPFAGGRGPPPMMRVMMMCGKDMSWPELRDKNCTEYMDDITTKIEQLYGDREDDFFSWKISMISQHMNNGNAEPPCDKIVCFKRTLMQKILTEGLPSFCEGRTDEAPDLPQGGFASLLSPANREELIDNMKDGFCFGMNKLSGIVHAKIVKDQLGLPDHGLPAHGRHMFHRMREQADCDNFDTTDVNCADLNPDAYITAMYGTTEQWDTAVEQKKRQMWANMRTQGPSGMCKAKHCYGNALDSKMQENNREMPSGCRSLFGRRREIFREPGFSNDKIKMISCFHAFKASLKYKMNQESLQCDDSIEATLNKLFSSEPETVNEAVETIMAAWQQAQASGRQVPETIPDKLVCRMKAIRDKLQQQNNQLPAFCMDEEKFDKDLTSASVQDVKELLCMKMERLIEHMFD